MLKFGGMRKEQEFTVQPHDGTNCIILQSDTRIAELYLHEGRAELSADKPEGAQLTHLHRREGSTFVRFPKDKLIEIKKYLWEITEVIEFGLPVPKKPFSSDSK